MTEGWELAILETCTVLPSTRRAWAMASPDDLNERLSRIEKRLERFYGHEYKSSKTLWGWPLVHIVQGMDPDTGRPRIAKGILAIGNVAIGAIAVGGTTFGGLTLGGFSVGLISIGGMSVGILAALGGAALSLGIAIGGLAIGTYAVGGFVLGFQVLGGNARDPQLLKLFNRLVKIL